jgi:SPP1 gp7 family putative phage head morphogenesis protein
MRSITTGKGMEDLVPFLTKKYKGNIRHARNVALDQTRKAYQSINTSRLKSMGVKSFIWIHSGGGKEPRQNHIKMSGNEYSFDNPPIIGVMYGENVRGLPGDLPNCRCICKPVINFDLEE